MTRELRDVLSETEAALAATLPGAMDEVTKARLVRKVRIHRATRATARGSVAAVAVGAVGFAGYLGLRRGEVPIPAATASSPGPTSSTSPAPPTPTPTPTPTATVSSQPAGTVDVPGLGALPRATGKILASTKPGWALAWYEPMSGYPGQASSAPLALAVLLVSPEGTVYHVVDLDPGVGLDPAGVLRDWRWKAGSTIVQVPNCAKDETSCGIADLDLTSGAVSPWAGSRSNDTTLGWTSDGRAVVQTSGGQTALVSADGTRAVVPNASANGTGAVLDPTGTQIAYVNAAGDHYALVSLTGGPRTDGPLTGGQCTLVQWVDPTHLLFNCPTSGGLGREFQEVDTQARPSTSTITPSKSRVTGGHVDALTDGAGTVLFSELQAGVTTGCAQVWRWRAGSDTQLTHGEFGELWGIGGGRTFVGETYCGDNGPTSVQILTADGGSITAIARADVAQYMTTVLKVVVARD